MKNKLGNSDPTLRRKNMKAVYSIASLFAIALLPTHSVASVYKCTDSQGKTAYQSSPCAEEVNALKIDMKTGQSTDLAVKIKQQQQEVESKKQEDIARQQQAAKDIKRKKDSIEQSAINQQLIKDNPIQFTAFAIPPYNHDKLPALVKNFEARLPEIEKFRRLAAQKALATGECNRVESDQLSVQSKADKLVFSIDCSSAKRFQFNETELLK